MTFYVRCTMQSEGLQLSEFWAPASFDSRNLEGMSKGKLVPGTDLVIPPLGGRTDGSNASERVAQGSGRNDRLDKVEYPLYNAALRPEIPHSVILADARLFRGLIGRL